jgi:putative hemolysin
VDEFGSVQGMLTLIDVLEAIVGDLPDQLRRAQPEAKRRDDGSWLIDATMATGEIKELLALKVLPGEDKADFQTLGGFIITHFGRIPAAGDSFDWDGWRFEVMDMDRQRVDKVLVSRAPALPGVAEEKASA